jgi:O-antigen/teichoic acid export membrane protein
VGKNIFYSILTQIPLFILGIVSGVFSTRVLGEEAKGAFTLYQANSQLFVMIFSFGIQTAIVYFISSQKKTQEKVFGLSVITFIISSFFFGVFLLLSYISDVSNYFLPNGYNKGLYLIGLFAIFILTFSSNILSSILRGNSKFKIINVVNIINTFINTIILTIIYFSFKHHEASQHEKFNIIMLATIAGLFFNNLIWLYVYLKQNYKNPILVINIKEELKPFILYSSSIFIGILINFFNYRLDLWIVNYMLDNKDLSYYSLAGNISQIILFVSITVGTVILPYLSSESLENKMTKFLSLSRISFLLFLGIVLIGYVLAPIIIPMLYGKDFYNSIVPFQIILPGILFSCITQILSQFLISINKNKFNIIACSIGLVFTIILDIIFIKMFGIIGASMATSIAYFAIFISTYLFVLSKSGYSNWNIFLIKTNDINILKSVIFKSKH